jgi:hypothetical protein
MHDHPGGVDDRHEAWFGQIVEDYFRMIQDTVDGKKRIIDLSGRFAVRGLKNCRPSRVDRGPDCVEYEHSGV